jgi:hypothetical protein
MPHVKTSAPRINVWVNRKDRKERKEDPFVRDTQKVHCDDFAFLAVLAVQSGIRDFDRSTFSGWSFR